MQAVTRQHGVKEDRARRFVRRVYTLLMAGAAVLVLVGCALVQRATPAAPTPSPVGASPTPRATQMPTEPTSTSTSLSQRATVTLKSTSPPSTATPPPPTASPAYPPPTPTATPSPLAPTVVIHDFRANVEVADPGESITLTWRWSGGTSATIYHLFPTGQLSEPYWDVGPTGSLQYTISPDRRNSDTFALHVYDGDGLAAQATVQIALRCPDEWFFSPAPDICPAGPALVTDGAEQHFERGTMLWIRAEDRIYVLFDDGQQPRWSAYEDEWDEGEPSLDPDIEPPPGLQQPVRGFGLVWREQSTVRERLGWAVDQERGYETALQRTSHVRYPVIYIRALDGGVWQLGPNGSDWDYVTAAR